MSIKKFPELLLILGKVAELDNLAIGFEFELLKKALETRENIPKIVIDELIGRLQPQFILAKSLIVNTLPTISAKIRIKRLQRTARLGAAYHSVRALQKNSLRSLIKSLDYLYLHEHPENYQGYRLP